MDLSEGMLSRARAQASEHGSEITFLVGDMASTDWWDGDQFDGAVCNMA